MRILSGNICTSLLIASITWMVSGDDVFSAAFISAAALAMLGAAISQPAQPLDNSKIFTAQVAALCGFLAVATLQFLNYRGVFFRKHRIRSLCLPITLSGCRIR